MRDLASFQGELARAIRDPDYNPAGFGAAGLSVYRNTVAKGLVDVLRANIPSVERIVGEDWFSACAQLFIRDHEPECPVLAAYGAAFPDFLRTFEPATQVPYLADVAQVDSLWTQSHFAPDEPPMDPAPLRAMDQDRLLGLSLPLHASTRIAWFDAPVATLWRLNRPPAPLPGRGGFSIDWRPEGIALCRPHGEVVAIPLSASQFAFLDACRAGRCFGEAVSAGPEGDTDGIGPETLGELFAASLFAVPPPTLSGRPVQ
ncbi:MAG: putative DNA-binding domain-containing protein [Caulobacterales bacterium]|nr:putative DNA-binding domain-containing protein [Caulobacterales bacterium]